MERLITYVCRHHSWVVIRCGNYRVHIEPDKDCHNVKIPGRSIAMCFMNNSVTGGFSAEKNSPAWKRELKSLFNEIGAFKGDILSN